MGDSRSAPPFEFQACRAPESDTAWAKWRITENTVAAASEAAFKAETCGTARPSCRVFASAPSVIKTLTTSPCPKVAATIKSGTPDSSVKSFFDGSALYAARVSAASLPRTASRRRSKAESNARSSGVSRPQYSKAGAVGFAR